LDNKVLGVVKTKAEAQAIVDAEVQAAQAAWDALPAEQQAMRLDRPADITLVE
jgi:alpha-D-ribose 1-methylphosphonate 5-triphosphate synthase subunit PhnG